ncbi:hypothetical protein C8R46DRAFT_1045450 [Mycena filopes]|nr:hypothetical protein C8R46DRAFT_1045450 [Mycena filopes]
MVHRDPMQGQRISVEPHSSQRIPDGITIRQEPALVCSGFRCNPPSFMVHIFLLPHALAPRGRAWYNGLFNGYMYDTLSGMKIFFYGDEQEQREFIAIFKRPTSASTIFLCRRHLPSRTPQQTAVDLIGKPLVLRAIEICPTAIEKTALEDLLNALDDEEDDVRNACEALYHTAVYARADRDLLATQAEIEDEIRYIQGRVPQTVQELALIGMPPTPPPFSRESFTQQSGAPVSQSSLCSDAKANHFWDDGLDRFGKVYNRSVQNHRDLRARRRVVPTADKDSKNGVEATKPKPKRKAAARSRLVDENECEVEPVKTTKRKHKEVDEEDYDPDPAWEEADADGAEPAKKKKKRKDDEGKRGVGRAMKQAAKKGAESKAKKTNADKKRVRAPAADDTAGIQTAVDQQKKSKKGPKTVKSKGSPAITAGVENGKRKRTREPAASTAKQGTSTGEAEADSEEEIEVSEVRRVKKRVKRVLVSDDED